uniref:CCHC-type domain-containing protein n=1 Tax=Sander lucioperca TaxID=283035 RepID=A0A8C9WWL4_SANLU
FSGGGQLSKRITISNAPPFIKNEDLAKELSRYGQLISPIKMVLLGCKSPKLKHVVCHRRHVFMKDNAADLNLTFSFKVEGFSYVVFATSDTMKCFGCGEEGHLVRFCPRRPAPDPAERAPGPSGPAPDPAGSDGSAETAPGPAEPAPDPDGSGGSADRAADDVENESEWRKQWPGGGYSQP